MPKYNLRDAVIVGSRWNAARNQWEPVALYPEAGSMREHGNGIVIGPPGAGKTRMLETNLLNWQHSAVVIDLKGSLFDRTAGFRSTLGKVIRLDPRSGTGSRFNPLLVIRKDQRQQLALGIATRGAEVDAESRFWANAAVSVWLACWAGADVIGAPHMPYAVEIMRLGLIDALAYFWAIHREDRLPMMYITQFLGQRLTKDFIANLLKNGPSRLLESKWSSATESSIPYDNENVLKVFSGHDVDIEGMFYEPSTVYVQADETNPEIFAAFSRLVMGTMGDALIIHGDKTDFTNRRPILFLFDEYGNIKLDAVAKWLNTMRSRGIVLWLFVQKLSQIPSGAKERVEDDENSIHHWVIYKPILSTGRVGQLISKLSGLTSVNIESGSSRNFSLENGTSYSSSDAIKERYVFESEDIEVLQMAQVFLYLTQKQTEKYLAWSATPENSILSQKFLTAPNSRETIVYTQPLKDFRKVLQDELQEKEVERSRLSLKQTNLEEDQDEFDL